MVGYTTLDHKAESHEESLPNVGDVHHHDRGLHDGPVLKDPNHARLDAFITTMTMRCMAMLSMMPPRLYLNSKHLQFFILKPFHSCASDSIFDCSGSFSSLGQSLLGPYLFVITTSLGTHHCTISSTSSFRIDLLDHTFIFD